jgi:hypothetical protein
MKKGGRLFSVCSLENKYFDGGLAGTVFAVFWLPAVFTGWGLGIAPPLAGLLESILWLDFSGKVLKGNGLEAKY